MTRIPIRAGAIIFVLVLALAFPVLAQGQGDEAVAPEDFDQLRKRVDSLEGKVEELASASDRLDEVASSNESSIYSLKEEQAKIADSLASLRNIVSEGQEKWGSIPELRKDLETLQGRVEKLVSELGKINQETSDEARKTSELADELRSVRNDLAGVRTDIVEIKDNLKNIRENTFDNEKRLADLQESYQASARRNLLVAASGIVIGLVAITLYWT
ncbi:hypothetical protein K9M78_06260 [Candidatus Bipolaricaulota bacterium]|nr:hypothetical protein [Candidatus Bipolaricaulota bacterium]